MKRNRHLRRGIYLLPTMLTIGNLFCGFAAMIVATRGAYAQAAVLIIVAGVLDGLDGRIARLTGTTSDFGLQFDSMADIASFGIAPALLGYLWALQPLGRLGWLIAFIYVVCAAMRLARFNIRSGRGDTRFFAGLPSPAGAGMLASVVFAFPAAGAAAPGWLLTLAAILVAALGLLMISRFRYRSFKEFDLRNRSYTYVLPLTIIIVAIAIDPRWSLLAFGAMYVLSAPVFYFVGLARRLDDGALGASSNDVDVRDRPATR